MSIMEEARSIKRRQIVDALVQGGSITGAAAILQVTPPRLKRLIEKFDAAIPSPMGLHQPQVREPGKIPFPSFIEDEVAPVVEPVTLVLVSNEDSDMENKTLEQIREEHIAKERNNILNALEASGGNVSAAARALQMSRYQLLRRLDKHGLRGSNDKSIQVTSA
jgi:transcriptional regulator with GAF, ATPase, and Fis domain